MAANPEEYFAHSANRAGERERVFTHLQRVAELSGAYTAVWGAEWEGRAAGLLHDLGKYGALFQERLAGRAAGIDHSTPGARAAAERYGAGGLGVAITVLGHHGGLRSAEHRQLNQATDSSPALTLSTIHSRSSIITPPS